jgi:hypothetical protein
VRGVRSTSSALKVSFSLRASSTSPRRRPPIAPIATLFATAASKSASIAARLNGITYGQLIHGLKAAGIDLDRKILADIAVKDAAAFTLLAEQAKAAAPPQKKKKSA